MTSYKFKNVDPIRSKQMSAIRSKNTTPELLLRKSLFRKGLRYRIHYKKLPGKPDIVFVKKRVAIFCDSEFWHGGSNWDEKKNRIKNNRDYWIPKIGKNIQRDKDITKKISEMGWVVLRFWEKDIQKDIDKITNRILKILASQET